MKFNIQTPVFYILIVFWMVADTGCQKFLTQSPKTQITASSFWKSQSDIDEGVAAMYNGLQLQNSYNFIAWGDGRSDNLTASTQYGNIAYSYNGLSASINGSDWATIYTTIERANDLLKHVPIIANTQAGIGIGQLAINNYMAQGYAVRAYCYFQIVKVWGGAPVWTIPFDSVGMNPYLPRSSAQYLLDSIVVPDLLRAGSLADPSQNVVWYANLGGIYAMLMDVSMWKHDYAGAINWYNKLVAMNRYKLEPTATWKNLFIAPQNSSESIWSLTWDWTVNGGVNLSGELGAGNTNSTFHISNNIWNYFTNAANSKDIRGAQSIDFKQKNQDKTLKYYPVNLDSKGNQLYPNNSQANAYFPLYRLADLVLLRAEAANDTYDLPTALTLLNSVHTRAGLIAYTAAQLPDSTTTSNAILTERQYELFVEGKRWYDLVRNGLVSTVMDPIMHAQAPSTQSYASDPRKILWPININDLNANPQLVQNPPY